MSSSQCDAVGLAANTRGRLVRSGRWGHPIVGVLDVEPHHAHGYDAARRRSAWLGMLAYGPDAVPVGASALALMGVGGLPTTIRPEVVVPGRRPRPRPGIVVRYDSGFPTVRFGDRVVPTLEAALVQALPRLGREDAVSVLDSVLNTGRLDVAGLAQVRAATRRRRGARLLDEWWHLVDGRAQSPLETRARLVWTDAGVPPDDLQVAIRDRTGRLLGIGDVGWRLRGGRWLLAELDGRDVHGTPDAVYADRHRQNALLATGAVDLVRFTHADVQRPIRLIAPIRAALAAAA